VKDHFYYNLLAGRKKKLGQELFRDVVSKRSAAGMEAAQ
jgi:hypothetical protein